MRKMLVLNSIIALSVLTSCVGIDQRVNNQKTFAKVYGYVKYFHPSDEASQINWAKFSAFGANEIDKCRSEEQLARTLNKLFKPIAPTVKFTMSNESPDYDIKSLIPDNPSEFRQTYWQHNGVSTGLKWTLSTNSCLHWRNARLSSVMPGGIQRTIMNSLHIL